VGTLSTSDATSIATSAPTLRPPRDMRDQA
jgi:hypothetical protein